MLGIDAYLRGLAFGLILVISLGPIFFFLIQTSIEKGFLAGLSVACGTLVSDSMYITISLLSISQITNNAHFRLILGTIGAAVLVMFGVYNIFKKAVIKDMH